MSARHYAAPVVEVASVGGRKMRYIPGDTVAPEPYPLIRRCLTCRKKYDARTGKTCDCFVKAYPPGRLPFGAP